MVKTHHFIYFYPIFWDPSPIHRGWQDVAQQTKVQQRLELQHSQRESAETQLTTDRKEMQRLQVGTGKGSADGIDKELVPYAHIYIYIYIYIYI